jgi:hypothetical protein
MGDADHAAARGASCQRVYATFNIETGRPYKFALLRSHCYTHFNEVCVPVWLGSAKLKNFIERQIAACPPQQSASDRYHAKRNAFSA